MSKACLTFCTSSTMVLTVSTLCTSWKITGELSYIERFLKDQIHDAHPYSRADTDARTDSRPHSCADT